MPTAPDNHDAHDYAERIRDRLPRRLQELREAIGLSMYALWMKCGVSRDMISRIEDNVIRDSKTAGIFLLNVQGAVVRGNTFESVTSHFAPTETYESIFLKDSTDVRVSDEVLKDIRVKAKTEPSH